MGLVVQQHIIQYRQLKLIEHDSEYEVDDMQVLHDDEVVDDGMVEVELVGNDEADEVDMYIILWLVKMLLVVIAIVHHIS